MKKARLARRILPLFVFILLCVFNIVPAKAAASIGEIQMNVYIDSSGTANIEEIWHASVDSGTEGYKPYGNLGKSKIADFTVTDDTGAIYEYEDDWNVNGSFYQKQHKNSIHKTNGGLELCWGISEYGDRIYTLNYKITNFVNQYDDAQGVYFSLMPKEMDQSPSSVVITITSDYEFSVENAKIWAFGYDGNINFVDGAIIMDSGGRLRSSGYMTALVKFEEDYFNTENRVRKPFDDIYNEAMAGVEKEVKKENDGIVKRSSTRSFLGILGSSFLPSSYLFGSFFPFILFVVALRLLPKFLRAKRNAGSTVNSYSYGKMDFGPEGVRMPPLKQADYFREIPCNNDILRIYWVAFNYSLYARRDGSDIKSGLVGALLLKWLKQGYIKISNLPPKMLSFKDNNYAVDFRYIDMRSMNASMNRIEIRLLDMLMSAAGSNGMLEPKEFGKWCKTHYLEVESWFDAALAYATGELRSAGLITESVDEVPPSFFDKIFNTKRTRTTEHVNPAIRQEALQIQGLQRFLLEFSAIAQREFIEVHIWEDYLVFAQLLGIADKVREQFSKVYPNFDEISRSADFGTDIGSNLAREIAVAGCVAASRAREAAESSSSGGSSDGGGGSSYSSGGDSAGGSSSGGGFR